jgi:hypothetical protein
MTSPRSPPTSLGAAYNPRVLPYVLVLYTTPLDSPCSARPRRPRPVPRWPGPTGPSTAEARPADYILMLYTPICVLVLHTTPMYSHMSWCRVQPRCTRLVWLARIGRGQCLDGRGRQVRILPQRVLQQLRIRRVRHRATASGGAERGWGERKTDSRWPLLMHKPK